ncbi:predicted protein [Methanosarcina acetivorans C2A]|uniref:Uncharacterized protein n=2 Tax=Methanosarcina acetivorans TaxID=2214 RepID=Q8TIK6_METAC|nr:predicted protein [Methanosarcina acetivorans C2A]
MNKSFKPSVKACKGCGNLIWTFLLGRGRHICSVSDKTPGNMAECPLQASERRLDQLNPIRENLQEMEKVMEKACRVSPENSRKNDPIANFVDDLILFGGLNVSFTSPQARKDREEYQEIVSCIVKAARKHGYEIPEEEA